jgi:hypothetical protein
MDANRNPDRYNIDTDPNTPTAQKSGFKLDGRTIAIGLLVIVAAIIFLPRLLGSGNQTVTPTAAVPNSNEPIRQGNISLPQPVAASGIDADGCPNGTTSTFSSSQPIYVVAVNSNVPSGTGVYARLYRDGQPVEDAPELVADRDYTNTCINFVFEPVNQPFQAGDYEAQFIVNGNPGPSVTFRVQ